MKAAGGQAAQGHGPPWAPHYAYLSEGAPIAFESRAELEDFRVDELLDEEPEGCGTHVWFQIEKRAMATAAAARRLAKHLGVPPASVGWAGRKDARAVTRQWLSVEHVEPERVLALELPGIRVLRAERAEKKLRIGQLAGNRFAIVLKGLGRASQPVGAARELLERRLRGLSERGVPNYYGAQRFGWNGRAFELGERLVRRDFLGYVALLCSPDHGLRPEPDVPLGAASTRHDRHVDALQALGRELELPGSRLERELVESCIRALGPELAGLVRSIGRGERQGEQLAARVPRRLARLHVSAFASRIFNDVQAARIVDGRAGIDELFEGDVAIESGSGRVHVVEAGELAVSRSRAARFELSPTGPMAGARALGGRGYAAEIEERVLAAHGVAQADFGCIGLGLDQRGTRRALRVQLEDLSIAQVEGGVALEFCLPSGAFASTVLEELARSWAPERGSRSGPSADDRVGRAGSSPDRWERTSES